jgi:hypothetical protein
MAKKTTMPEDLVKLRTIESESGHPVYQVRVLGRLAYDGYSKVRAGVVASAARTTILALAHHGREVSAARQSPKKKAAKR